LALTLFARYPMRQVVYAATGAVGESREPLLYRGTQRQGEGERCDRWNHQENRRCIGGKPN
jgi:hypothetical protein